MCYQDNLKQFHPMVSMTKDSYCIEIAVIIVFNFGGGGGDPLHPIHSLAN